MPTALQSIENYCSIDTFYPTGPEPLASSSQYPSTVLPTPSVHIYPSDECLPPPPPLPSSSSAMMLPQNRANYTRHQLIMLNEIFREHKYPNSLQKTLIAKHIGVSRDQIRIWFQNKRRKVQLINKGQAKHTKTDVECEYGEYRRQLPKNYLADLFQELYKARGAPARLPVKRENSNKLLNTEQEPQQQQLYPVYFPPMHSTNYYPSTHLIEQNDEKYSIDYSQHMYADRL